MQRKFGRLLFCGPLSNFFFHYNNNEKNLSEEYNTLNLSEELDSSQKFKTYTSSQLDRYANNQNYSPLAVCFGLRNKIETHVAQSLNEAQRIIFQNTKKTRLKLDYAVDQGASVPDTFYLLGVVYNYAAHFNSRDYDLTQIVYKLENKVIKSMILEVNSLCSS